MALQCTDLDRLALGRLPSVGQPRAHMPPRMFWLRIVFAAASGVPVMICRMKSSTSIEVGQASVQGASWQK